MRKNSNIGDNGVPRSGNRSRDISSGNKNEHGSGILAMNGCGDLGLSLSPLDDHRPIVTAGIADSGRRLAHIVRESRGSPRLLWRTVNGETVGVPWLVNVQPRARRRSLHGILSMSVPCFKGRKQRIEHSMEDIVMIRKLG
jgi:hypothetical protein